jgi:ankyrin repeat protein
MNREALLHQQPHEGWHFEAWESEGDSEPPGPPSPLTAVSDSLPELVDGEGDHDNSRTGQQLQQQQKQQQQKQPAATAPRVTSLFAAAADGDAPEVQRLLDAGANVHERGCFGRTALFGAALSGSSGVMQALLRAGAAPGARDNRLATPLHVAAAEGHAAVVRLLVEAGARASAVDALSTTPLDTAAFDGRDGVVRQLLQLGHHSASDLTSAAMNASEGGHDGLALLLLNHLAATDAAAAERAAGCLWGDKSLPLYKAQRETQQQESAKWGLQELIVGLACVVQVQVVRYKRHQQQQQQQQAALAAAPRSPRWAAAGAWLGAAAVLAAAVLAASRLRRRVCRT